MEYKIIICDDSAEDTVFLTELTALWGKHSGHTIRMERFDSAEAFLFRYEEDKTCDILLLDVEMPGLSGVELAKKIRKNDDALQIVFVTGYSDYIAEGYEVSALHYLMKPVDREKLFSVLDRAVSRIKSRERALLLECVGETVRVPLHEIRYMDVRQNYVTVHARED